MLRAAARLTLIAGCGALMLDPQPDDARQLSETDRTVMKILGAAAGSAENSWFGTEAAAAEAKALRARQALQSAEAKVDSNFTERQLTAMDHRAQSEMTREIVQEMKIASVVDSMMREGDSEDRAAEGIERRDRLGVADEEREFEKFERTMKRMDRDDAIDTNSEMKEIRREELQEQDADLEFAHETAELKKELKDARDKANLVKGKERDYLKLRMAIEAETRKRLWQEADAMRTSASNLSNGALSEIDIVHLLDITLKELDNITNSIVKMDEDRINTSWYDEHLSGLRFKSVSASSAMLEVIKFKAGDFKNTHHDYTDHQFMGFLHKLLNDTKTEVRSFMQTSDAVLGRLQRWDGANSEKLTYNMAVALHGVTGNVEFKNHILQVDVGSLRHASAAEACDRLSSMITSNVEPAYRSLVRMKGAMDSISKIVPSILQSVPESAQSLMVNRTTTVVNMAYAQQLALTEASSAILQQAVPVIADRLHCDFSSSGSVRSGVGLAALGAAVAWLGQ